MDNNVSASIPCIALPPGIICYLLRFCWLDLWMLAFWFIAMLLSLFILQEAVRKEYKKTLEQMNEACKEMAEEAQAESGR